MNGVYYRVVRHTDSFTLIDLLIFYNDGVVIKTTVNDFNFLYLRLNDSVYFEKKEKLKKGKYQLIDSTKLKIYIDEQKKQENESVNIAVYDGEILGDELYLNKSPFFSTPDLFFLPEEDTYKKHWEISNLIKQELDFFPIVLIPEIINNCITHGISNVELDIELKNDTPNLKTFGEPQKPDEFIYQYIDRIKYKGGVINFISYPFVIIFFFIVGLYSLESQSKGIISIMFTISFIAFISFITMFKKEKKRIRVKKEEENYEKEIVEYNKRISEVKKNNENEIRRYEKEIADFKVNRKEKIKDLKRDLYLKKISSNLSFSNNKTKNKRGRAELMFLSLLYDKFRNQIFVDCKVEKENIVYFPDFILKCEKTNLHIDIEIDEPYSFSEKEPIHYKGIDNIRNKFFLEMNWCVLRFSEEQILKYPNECCDFISRVFYSIRDNKQISLDFKHKKAVWTYEEAMILMHKKVRDGY